MGRTDWGHGLDKRHLRAAFERAAGTYDEAAVLQREVCSRLLSRLDLIRIRPGTVLDLGCGTGQGAAALLSRYRRARIMALDLAVGMLHRTRARAGWLRRPRLLCADAEALPLANASLDLVFSNLTLQWCNDLEATLGGIRRVLAPGGLLMFSTFGPDTLKELRESWRAVDLTAHVNVFADMHEVGDALLRQGFADPVMDMELITLTYPDVGSLMRELKAIGAQNHLAARARGLTGKGRLRAVERAYEGFRMSDGRYPASFEVVYGHAWAPEAGAALKEDAGVVPVGFIGRP